MSTPRTPRWPRKAVLALSAAALFIAAGSLRPAFAQNGVNPLGLYQNYFVTGDYVVAGWVEGAPDGSGYAPGMINIPDALQPGQPGVPASVPKGADIVAAYLYWATVESNQSSYAGTSAYFNGYPITGTVLGNPNAPTSWSSGGCSGSSQGAKTMRTYRADVHPYLPIDNDPNSATFGATIANGSIPVRLTDSGSNGNAAPFALGATLVVIYRVLNPGVPLNAIVLYDGAYAPSNTSQTISQALAGFYEPDSLSAPVAKITHIVANGQPNKNEQVYLNSTKQPLPSLYPGLPPFPGRYNSNGSAWDNPTWLIGTGGYGYVRTADTQETTSVIPSKSNTGCVSWGAIILSTTVADQDHDGLLDMWEQNQGYADVVRGADVGAPTLGQWVALPGANYQKKDIFIELDYLNNLDGSAGPSLHSHLPKEDAINAVGKAFANQNISVHFDLGPGVYQGNPYVIGYPVTIPPLPPGVLPPQSGAGGNAISEGQLVCTDGAALCAFPGQPAIGWKGGFEAVKNDPTLGNFQPGRDKSYHYMLLGHSLGEARSFWSTVGSALGDPTYAQLVSVANSGATATVTIKSPQGVVRPGDCASAGIPGCTDANTDRITISGALGQTALNGTYQFSNVVPGPADNNGVTTTTFTVATTGVADGPYTFANEPQLAVTYLGPTSSSGHSEFGGGGDSSITLGLWGFDDPTNCQPDPTQALTPVHPVYCNNQVGTTDVQTGTIMHELGHTLALTHGGIYFNDPNNPSLPTYELNCKPNFLSVMSYLFQVRGFVDGGFDYSSQNLTALNETSLNEGTGIGTDVKTSQPPAHLSRWYSIPNSLDIMLQQTTGGRYAKSHCDGSPLGPNDVSEVRDDPTIAGNLGAGLDWNNDLNVGDTVSPPGVDVNYNGFTGDAPFSGFNDWQFVNLQQIGARENAFGLSGGGAKAGGGGAKAGGGGAEDDDGGGAKAGGGGAKAGGGGAKAGGGGAKAGGGGIDQNEDTATTTVDSPVGLACTTAIGSTPACVGSGTYTENARAIPLTWSPPGFGQIRTYVVWRAVGSFTTSLQVLQHMSAFTQVKTLTTGAPPAGSWTDPNVKNNTTYTYFVTDANKQGATSGPSAPLVITVKF